MKKTLQSRIAILLLALTLMLPCILAGCDTLKQPTTKYTSESTLSESPTPYKIVDSFSVNESIYFYVFELGTIDSVPMNISGADGVPFNGTETELTFHYSETEATESSQHIAESLESSVSLSTSVSFEAAESAKIKKIFNVSLKARTETTTTQAITHTYSESFTNSISHESTFEKTMTCKMSKDDPTGFYFYTPIASMKVFEVVAYNPSEDKIEAMFSYSQFSPALVGLYYSPNGFIDYDNFEIKFEESKLPQFTKPGKNIEVDTNLQIPVSQTFKINSSANPSPVTININDYFEHFDLNSMKSNGYKMRLTFNCKVSQEKAGGIIGDIIGNYKYNIHLYSNGNEFCTFTDSIESTKTLDKEFVYDIIDLQNISEEISFNLSTKNIRDLKMTDISIKIEFVK